LCRRCRSSSFVKGDGQRVDVAESILLKPRRVILKVSGVRLSSMLEKIFRELEGFSSSQIEVLKSRGFSGSFYCLGVVASFRYTDGVFDSWCCVLKLAVGVNP
jgi:hypothetical protein